MSDTLAEESTTLPEGAQLSVARVMEARKTGGSVYTILRAYRENKVVSMRISDVAACNLSTYLKLIRREIERRRSVMDKKPDPPAVGPVPRTPKGMGEFVLLMALADMFMFEALAEQPNETKPVKKSKKKRNDVKGTKRVPKVRGVLQEQPPISQDDTSLV